MDSNSIAESSVMVPCILASDIFSFNFSIFNETIVVALSCSNFKISSFIIFVLINNIQRPLQLQIERTGTGIKNIPLSCQFLCEVDLVSKFDNKIFLSGLGSPFWITFTYFYTFEFKCFLWNVSEVSTVSK